MGSWIIFAIIVVLLIGFFLWSTIKDRNAKNRKKREKIMFTNTSKIIKRRIVFQLKTLIDINQKYLDNFEPSVGAYKMSQITDTAHNYLMTLENDKNFKEFIVAADDQNEILNAYINLRDLRSNSWAKKIPNVIEYLQNLYNDIDLKAYSEELEEVTKDLNSFYDAEFCVKEVK